MEDIASILIVLVSTPFWLPLARAIWGELTEGLANEGGLFGARKARTTSHAEGLDVPSSPAVQASQRLGRKPSPTGSRCPGPKRLPSARWN